MKKDNKVFIWGNEIPFNTGEPKKNYLKMTHVPSALRMLPFAKDIFGPWEAKSSANLDSFTWSAEVRKGYASKNMDDKPFVEPFFADGDKAVIIAPGGGFCYLSRESEGYKVAKRLQEKGINAFVLTYRLNPYRAPVYWLDLQRAVRFVRSHAEEWHIDKDKVGVVGFSAGAVTAGALTLMMQDSPVNADGYTPDAVDQENGLPSFSGLIYPLGCFDYNQNVLMPLIGEDYLDDAKRKKALHDYSLVEHLEENTTTPQFLCYGTMDMLVRSQKPYAEKLGSLGGKHKILVLKGANHGFGATQKKYVHWLDEFADWINSLYE